VKAKSQIRPKLLTCQANDSNDGFGKGRIGNQSLSAAKNKKEVR
jgi:hypothetical protein